MKVPANPKMRDLMRKEAALLVMGRNLLPPANLDDLEKLGTELIKNLDLAEEYTDFALVLIGNETWRPTVAATPFNRRLLLLPQCLKSNGFCQGTFDELGLLCAGCKGCIINDVLDEAEKLGYTTLVAEGTTVAIGLVEEGSIDAVIGVSCMPVLQRSFDQVSRAAVPVIGLPLMYDGCTNTNVDYNWLLEEIQSDVRNEAAQPLSVSLIKLKVQDYFTEQNLHKVFPLPAKTESLAMEMMLQGGQRMRPLLAVLAYLAYSTERDENSTRKIAVIIECFHKASLIHDDIEDDSNQRYDSDTLHRKHGIAMAINVGDYLIGKGYHLLSELSVSNELIFKCLQVISSSHIRLTQGQGADIMLNPLDEAFTTLQAIEIFKLKTGEAVKVALLLGAIAGGAAESELQILGNFSDSFGVAYQIRDDLSEFQEKKEGEKTSDFPFLAALFNEYSSQNKVPDRQFSEGYGTMKYFREKIEQFNLISQAEEILQNYIDRCYTELDNLQNLKLRLSLYGVLGKIFKTQNSDG